MMLRLSRVMATGFSSIASWQSFSGPPQNLLVPTWSAGLPLARATPT
jgi:hypothetical protein